MVGVAYLDKGLIVITDPTIIANYELATGMTSGVTVTLAVSQPQFSKYYMYCW
jgi:hypothetical protein